MAFRVYGFGFGDYRFGFRLFRFSEKKQEGLQGLVSGSRT